MFIELRWQIIWTSSTRCFQPFYTFLHQVGCNKYRIYSRITCWELPFFVNYAIILGKYATKIVIKQFCFTTVI